MIFFQLDTNLTLLKQEKLKVYVNSCSLKCNFTNLPPGVHYEKRLFLQIAQKLTYAIKILETFVWQFDIIPLGLYTVRKNCPPSGVPTPVVWKNVPP